MSAGPDPNMSHKFGSQISMWYISQWPLAWLTHHKSQRCCMWLLLFFWIFSKLLSNTKSLQGIKKIDCWGEKWNCEWNLTGFLWLSWKILLCETFLRVVLNFYEFTNPTFPLKPRYLLYIRHTHTRAVGAVTLRLWGSMMLIPVLLPADLFRLGVMCTTKRGIHRLI